MAKKEQKKKAPQPQPELEPQPEEWITGAELSRRLRCQPAKISHLYQQGVISRRRHDKRYDWHTVKHVLGEGGVILSPMPVETAPDKPQPLTAGLPADASATQSKAYWQAMKAEEDYLKQRVSRLHLQGQLIKRETAERYVSDLASTIRQQLAPIGGRLAATLAAESDPRQCQDLVEGAIREALLTSSDVFATRKMEDDAALEDALDQEVIDAREARKRSSKKRGPK